MSPSTETMRQIEEALAPYARSRDQVTQIRSILAAHLQSCIEDGQVPRPLGLASPKARVTSTSELKGLQREYVKALNSNIKAQRAFRDVQPGSVPVQNVQSFSHHDRLTEHIASLRLQKKEESLKAVDRHLELLSLKAAAQSDFLAPDHVFQSGPSLPGVPKKVVDGFAIGGDPTKTDLKGLNKQLEKSVLKAKLLLRQEERLLEDIKSRSSHFSQRISDHSKFQALSATRSELISWIENELSNASTDEAEEDGHSGQPDRPIATDWGQLEDHLAQVRDKYAQYISARKSLIQTASQNPQPIIQPKAESASADDASALAPARPSTHLYSPYLEAMLEATQNQKGFISQKSHLNVLLSKEAKSTCLSLDHLVEESRIIPLHPLPGRSRRNAALDGLGEPDDATSVTSRAKAWAYAADAAKIALLEAVAEKVEEGQVALEGSMHILDEIDQLLGRQGGQDEPFEADIWLAEGAPSGKASPPTTAAKKAQTTDIWAKIGQIPGDIACSL